MEFIIVWNGYQIMRSWLSLYGHRKYNALFLYACYSIGVGAGPVGTVLTGPLFFTKLIFLIHKTDNNNY